MILHYFKFQSSIAVRKIKDSGLDPWLGILLFGILLTGGSVYLFSKTDAAGYFIALIGLALLIPFSEKERNDFLRITLSKKHYQSIRLIENGLMLLPFLIVLLAFAQITLAMVLLVLGMLMSFQRMGKFQSTVRFSPFGKHPFEFASGIRNSILLYLAVDALLIPAMMSNNASLGMFVLGMHFLLAFSFYTQVENEILVWNFHGGPKKFLLHKISAAFRQITLLNFPVVLILCISWPENWWIILVVYVFGLLLLSSIVLAKYSAFPRVMNVPEGIVMAVTVSFPPLLILAIPYFYKKAHRQLQTILYDSDLRA
jgi:hypothetical protein